MLYHAMYDVLCCYLLHILYCLYYSGMIGDGPKWMCGVDILPQDALIYSFGSNGDTSFERAVNKITSSTNIFIFDPTLDDEKRLKVAKSNNFTTLIEVGLSANGTTNFNVSGVSLPVRGMKEHMAALGHSDRKINVLKVDIDGSEYKSFRNLKVGECVGADVFVDQLLIEVHTFFNKEKLLMKLMQRFAKCNLRLFNKERNAWGCDGYNCVEYSFVAPSFAFEVFKSTHPSCGA
jgi:hypothetical protein